MTDKSTPQSAGLSVAGETDEQAQADAQGVVHRRRIQEQRAAAEEDASKKKEKEEDDRRLRARAQAALYFLGAVSYVFQLESISHELQRSLLHFSIEPEPRSVEDFKTIAEAKTFTAKHENANTLITVTETSLQTNPGIGLVAAYNLTLLAKAHPEMLKKGVRVSGTDRDRVLLYLAATQAGLKVENKPDDVDPELWQEAQADWDEFIAAYKPPVDEALFAEVLKQQNGGPPATAATEDPPREPGKETPAPEPEQPEQPKQPDWPWPKSKDGESAVSGAFEEAALPEGVSAILDTQNVSVALYDRAKDYVLVTGKVSRARLMDEFNLKSRQAEAIMHALKHEGVIKKGGANKHVVVVKLDAPATPAGRPPIPPADKIPEAIP